LLSSLEVEVQDLEIGRFVAQKILQAQFVEAVGFEQIDFFHDSSPFGICRTRSLLSAGNAEIRLFM
jgi:hypothetical protein